ncbi:MAG: hypothetical protein Q8Q20_04515 [bacterium]|nr:hypothetical protein [bacterium]
MSNPPYVVSGDAELLLGRWAEEKGFTIPPTEHFAEKREGLLDALCRIFPVVEWISAEKLSSTIRGLVGKIEFPIDEVPPDCEFIDYGNMAIVSMTRSHWTSQYHIDVSRSVNQEGNDVGSFHRAGSAALDIQYQSLAQQGITDVVLVDDVVFSGGQACQVIEGLKRHKIRVRAMIAGIWIDEGWKRVHQQQVRTLASVCYKNLIDEVCERDFIPGTPLCGRSLAHDGNAGFPYILPFGRPGDWASIPDSHLVSFSRTCLEISIDLFREIEKCSGREVQCRDLERQVVGLPSGTERFVDELQKSLDRLGS